MPRLLLLLLCLLPAAVTAAEEGQSPVLIWKAAGPEGIRIDTVLSGVTLTPAANGAFVDTREHLIGNQRFRAMYQVFDSNADSPMGHCGAGREIELFVYELIPPKPVERGRILISSCLETVSLASQNSGSPESESDFSSVVWQHDGFTITWWGAGPDGKASSHYALRNGRFVPLQSDERSR
ncbi:MULTISPECIES: hypothetical protein [Stenotrophomonas]|uniref:hypothetical protein n=1 Tax=Stenotrophomonas TaxID=40323 RepID=UPI001C60B369|nr:MULTISPECIES: hypothetical protein [Stenotrophomonas]